MNMDCFVRYIAPAMWYLVGVESSLDPIEVDNAILQVDRHWHLICQTQRNVLHRQPSK